MRKKLISALLAGTIASSVSAGPLTDALAATIGGGELGWDVGLEEAGREVLEAPHIRLNDGSRFAAARADLGIADGQFQVIATDLKVRRSGTLGQLSADRAVFSGHAGYLPHLWGAKARLPACDLAGPAGGLRFEGVSGLVGDPAADGATRFAADSLELTAQILPAAGGCRLALVVHAAGLEVGEQRQGGVRSEELSLSLELPATLDTLRAGPTERVSLHLEGRELAATRPGGGASWSLTEGTMAGDFIAASLVPVMLAYLRHGDLTAAGAMEIWNGLDDAVGTIQIAGDGVIRTANVLPARYAAPVLDAGLSNLLFRGEAEIGLTSGRFVATAQMDTTGVARSEVDAEGWLSAYPEGVIARQADGGARFDRLPAIGIDRLDLLQTDQGLLAAASRLLGVPVTVWLQDVADRAAGGDPMAEAIMRDISAEVARFAAGSYTSPPAKLSLGIGQGLDLREAFVVSSRLPQELPQIFILHSSTAEGGE